MEAEANNSKMLGMFLGCCRSKRGGQELGKINSRKNNFVIQSCTAERSSWHSRAGENTRFTRFLLEAMKDDKLASSVSKMHEHVWKRMEDTNSLSREQTPEISKSISDYSFL